MASFTLVSPDKRDEVVVELLLEQMEDCVALSDDVEEIDFRLRFRVSQWNRCNQPQNAHA